MLDYKEFIIEKKNQENQENQETDSKEKLEKKKKHLNKLDKFKKRKTVIPKNNMTFSDVGGSNYYDRFNGNGNKFI